MAGVVRRVLPVLCPAMERVEEMDYSSQNAKRLGAGRAGHGGSYK